MNEENQDSLFNPLDSKEEEFEIQRDENLDKTSKLQPTLFEMPEPWEEHWQDMPEYAQEDLTSFQSIIVHFEKIEDREAFSKLVEQNIFETTKSIWYPKVKIEKYVDKRYIDEP